VDQLSYLVNWIAKDIFGIPAYLVGLMTLIALIASRKGAGDVVGGALKATLASSSSGSAPERSSGRSPRWVH
jgi:PTS system ascorbate-specific IIC component